MALGTLTESFEITTEQLVAYQTPSALVKSLIKTAHFVNTGNSPVTIDIWKTSASNETPSNANKKISQRQIGVNETYIADELIGQYINTGGRIYAQASAEGVSMTLGGNTFATEV